MHDQNDVGIMGSLPAQVDKILLASWKYKLVTPQDQLLAEILKVLPDDSCCFIDENIKLALAGVVRQHYRSHPNALSMQAQGNVIPATINNHS